MVRKISAEDKLTVAEIEQLINNSNEYDTVVFEGIFNFSETGKQFYILGNNMMQSVLMITKSNIRLDFNNAIIFLNIQNITCKTAFIYLFQTANNIKICGLNLNIEYFGENSNRIIYGIFNCGSSLSIVNSKLSICTNKQINITGIFNNGGINTHLNTKADNLSVVNCKIYIQIQPEKYIFPCEGCGIHNFYANSVQIADNYIEVINKGEGEMQKAIGIYNNGRFCRFSNNNIKANGSHNKVICLEAAHACGMIDEGMYSLISNSNIVGEWGGSCVGITLKGEFTKITGCKILSTHTIKGTTVKILGRKIIISDNIITSTSRNARIIYCSAKIVNIIGNIMEVVINPDECITGVGGYFENSNNVIFKSNQLLTIKTCGVYVYNSDVFVQDNLYQIE